MWCVGFFVLFYCLVIVVVIGNIIVFIVNIFIKIDMGIDNIIVV